MILPSISFSPEQRPQPLKELRGRKTDARQDHFHNAHGVGVVQCHYIFSNLISNACFERRTNDDANDNFFFRMKKICQKATKATIRKKELDRKAGQKKLLSNRAFGICIDGSALCKIYEFCFFKSFSGFFCLEGCIARLAGLH